MTNPTLERAARALYEFGMMADCPTWDQLELRYKEDFFDMARAVLMSVREIPDGFIRQRREMFYSTEFLEYDFATLVEAILADGGE